MGLFSKNKDNNNMPPKMPPAPPSASGNGAPQPPMPSPSSSAGGMPNAAPGMNSGVGSNIPAPGVGDLPSEGKLSPPPSPTGTLRDIKEEVSSLPSTNAGSPMPAPALSSVDDSSGSSGEGNESGGGNESFTDGLNDDSLFDFSDLNIDNPNFDSDTKKDSLNHESSGTQMGNTQNMSQNMSASQGQELVPMDSMGQTNNYSPVQQQLSQIHYGNVGQNNAPTYSGGRQIITRSPTNMPEGTQDTSMEEDQGFNFDENPSGTTVLDDTYFVTTHQFKSLLEIVEAVKERVKISNERHLRLLDIKAEEDIEYENLRKDFQFVEDKLYEVDSIIFER